MMNVKHGPKSMQNMVAMHDSKAHRLAMGESVMKINDPVSVRALPGGEYRVATPGGVKAKHTTKKKAMAQRRLLNAIEHNPDFKPRSQA